MMKKKLLTVLVSSVLIFSSTIVYADSFKTVTIGENLNDKQKQEVLNYFEINENEADIISVNNAEERKYLEGVASESQLGTKTFSCALVEPLDSGKGIEVKTNNLTWVTEGMIKNALITAGVNDVRVVATSPFAVSGTGALTGILKAMDENTEISTDISEDAKETANNEIVVTGELADEVKNSSKEEESENNSDIAISVINDIKEQVIKDKPKTEDAISEIVDNVINDKGITVSDETKESISALMVKINDLDIDYSSVKDSLKEVSSNLQDKLDGILTDENKEKAVGFFTKIIDWIKGLF